MKTGVEWALETDLKQKEMVLGILRVCWMVLLYFPPTSLVSFLLTSKVLRWQRAGSVARQNGANSLQWTAAAIIHPPVTNSMNPCVWASCQLLFVKSKIRTAPLGEKTWERGVLTTHENILNPFKNASLKATGFLKTEYPTVGSLEN